MHMASGTTARWAKVALIGLCALGVNAHAQRGGGGGGSGGSGEPPDYGDLIVLEPTPTVSPFSRATCANSLWRRPASPFPL